MTNKNHPKPSLQTAPLSTLADVKAAAVATGSHFFEPAAMRFFGCRLVGQAVGLPDGSAVFITSEQGPAMRRAYTVRRACHAPPGQRLRIDDVGGFGAHATEGQARQALAAMVTHYNGARIAQDFAQKILVAAC